MLKVVVIKHCSAGNEVAGEVWRETKIFSPDTTAREILKWAQGRDTIYPAKQHIEITVTDEEDRKG